MSVTNEELLRLREEFAHLASAHERQSAELARLDRRLQALLAEPDRSAFAKTEALPDATSDLQDRSRTTVPPRTSSGPPPLPPPSSPTPTQRQSSDPGLDPRASIDDEAPAVRQPRQTAGIERWIGQNILAVVGIGILLLGVGIGVRWAIENDYIGPLARVVMGYAVGVVLVGFAERLRKHYDILSAVLVGGGMAVLYFVTYVATGVYELLPTGFAFGLMVAFTAFTVLAALRYDRQLIAHLGLVGAYAVPFLLSQGGGEWMLMLGYVTVINLGILYVSQHRTWRPLVLVALALTWVIFYVMGLLSSSEEKPGLSVGLGFATLNWMLFLWALLSPKLRSARSLTTLEVAGLLLNGLCYFGLGYVLLDNETYDHLLGAFTLANGAVYLAVAYGLHRQSVMAGQPSRALPVLAGMAIAFVAVAVPVQLEGPTVTVLWASLGILLMFLAGRTSLTVMRLGAYAFLLLAFGSLVEDWSSRAADLPAVANGGFLATLFVAFAFGASAYLNRTGPQTMLSRAASIALALLALALLYAAGGLEIDAYYSDQIDALYAAVDYNLMPDGDSTYEQIAPLQWARSVWMVYYSMAFAALFALGEWVWRRRQPTLPVWLSYLALALLLLAVVAFLGEGLFSLSELRDVFLQQDPAGVQLADSPHQGWRYLGIGLFGALVALMFVRLRVLALPSMVRAGVELGFHVALLWVLSAELIHQLTMAASEVPYKLGLSILWGAYALLLIALGLLWRRAHLRYAAMALFALTLVKLFVYDLASLSTVAKTIVLVVLGVLLLVMSFLYTKFRDRIGDEKSI